MMRTIAAVLLLLTAGGCTSILASIAGDAVGVPMDAQLVASKMEPNVLVARGGETCTVSKSRWEKAKAGDRVLCAWQDSGRDPGSAAARR